MQGIGRMAAVLAPIETVEELARAVGRVEIAAINSARAVTIAGPSDALAEFKILAENRRIALLDLDLDYPFHSSLMEPIRPKLTADLHNMRRAASKIFHLFRPSPATCWRDRSSRARIGGAMCVSRSCLLKPSKWPAKLGVRFFVEIGPRAMLHKHIADALQGEANDVSVLSVLDRNDADISADPFAIVRSKALARGGQVNIKSIAGGDPGPAVILPNYPWQPQQFRFKPTVEAIAPRPNSIRSPEHG